LLFQAKSGKKIVVKSGNPDSESRGEILICLENGQTVGESNFFHRWTPIVKIIKSCHYQNINE
jgi:hypothetical protein